MQAMAEWYVKGDMDQGRLSRILDVAQDLKVRNILFWPLYQYGSHLGFSQALWELSRGMFCCLGNGIW